MIPKTPEHVAWREATAAGVELPDELADMWHQYADLESKRDEANRETVERVQAPTLILAGASVAEAVDAERQADHDAELIATRQKAAAQAVAVIADRITRTTAERRQQLIVERLRPVVADIIDEARSLVSKLEPFAPDFDPDEVAKWATPAHLKAWRSAAELQERLDRCLAAWLATWRKATSATDDHGLPGYLRIDAPGGIHVWERPHDVADVDVRDGRNRNVLAIAVYADAGYRLASGPEMVELSEHVTLEASWIKGELNPRQVFLPGAPVQPAGAQDRRQRAVFL